VKTSEKLNSADTENAYLDTVVSNVTSIVEEEATAFKALLEELLLQQTSILNGDSDKVEKTNQKVAEIVANTRKLENDRVEELKVLSAHLQVEIEDALNLTTLIPLVEQRYARRLEELKDILLILMDKIQSTNKRNAYLLDHSLEFVYNCMEVLVAGHQPNDTYSSNGKTLKNKRALYRGVG